MRKIMLLLTFLSFSLAWSQQDVEDNGESYVVTTENVKTLLLFDVKGVYQIADKDCDNIMFSSVKYETGEAQLILDLKKRIDASLNAELYAASGYFYIDIEVDKNGKLDDISFGPDIRNSRLLFDDLKTAVKKLKGKWIPAQCNGYPIDSKIRVKLMFDSTEYSY